MSLVRLGAARPLRIAVALAALALLALGVAGALQPRALAVAPANAAFERTWARTDLPAREGAVDRTWMWGPEAFTGAVPEPYAESPGGQRTVQYFDKSRMELTHPDAFDDGLWYVTNGLLVVELVSGRVQIGDDTFLVSEPAADVNVAGDPDDPTGPTYGTIAGVRAAPPVSADAPVIQRIDRAGTITVDPSLATHGVTAAQRVTVPGIDHQVASVFWEFMTSTGTVYEDGAYTTDLLFPNAFYATGFPISEAYWANVKVAGAYQDVLLQCFERRCLTYTPGNQTGWQVEAGNVGQHYERWRYPDGIPTTPTPTATPTTTPTPAPPVDLPDERLFAAQLSGANVVDASSGRALAQVDTDASGVAYFYVHDSGLEVSYAIYVNNIEDVTAAHIHQGGAGEAGQVLVTLFDGGETSVTPDGLLFDGSFTFEDMPAGMSISQLAQLMVDGAVYVNVHTIDYPDGEMRGQIAPLGDVVLHADLNGNNERPPVQTSSTGAAFFYYDAAGDTLSFSLSVRDLDGIVAAHIHEGGPTENGPVRVTLFSSSSPIPVPVNGELASGVIEAGDPTGVTLERLVYLMLTGNAYVNVHTDEHPDGAIRGQTAPGSGVAGTFLAGLSGIDESPPVSTLASGYALLSWNADGTLSFAVAVANLEGATEAHLHAGERGADGPVLATLFTVSPGTPGVENGILARGTLTSADVDDLAALAFEMLSGDTYVDVHTAAYSDGEIRGQVATAPGPVFLADITGDQVYQPDPNNPVVTDASGAGVFWLAATGLALNYWVVVDDLEDATAAHIHWGEPGDEGPVAATLFVATDAFPGVEDGLLAAGTLLADDLEGPFAEATIADLAQVMLQGGTYVNVHTEDYPFGEIRGQIRLLP